MVLKRYEKMHRRTPANNTHSQFTSVGRESNIFFLPGRGSSKINEAISRVKGTFQFGKQIYLHKLFFRHLLKKIQSTKFYLNKPRYCQGDVHIEKPPRTHKHTAEKSLLLECKLRRFIQIRRRL